MLWGAYVRGKNYKSCSYTKILCLIYLLKPYLTLQYFQARWNMAMLQSDDLVKAATKMITKDDEPAEFSKL